MALPPAVQCAFSGQRQSAHLNEAEYVVHAPNVNPVIGHLASETKSLPLQNAAAHSILRYDVVTCF